MAEKKDTTKKATVAHRTPAKKATRGDKYVCEVCGLGITIDEECGCAEFHEILCCGQPMKAKRVSVKSGK